MSKYRMEAFTDGVLAILITIMVLQLRVPHAQDLGALSPLIPTLLSYVLSFLYLGIFWNNHHHLMQAASRVSGPLLWANLHLLFWLSLIPFTTAWMGENGFAKVPTAAYGFVLLMASIAYFILQQGIIETQCEDPVVKNAIGRDWKGKLSPALYLVSVPAALLSRWISVAIYVVVALMWVVPDKRIERALSDRT